MRAPSNISLLTLDQDENYVRALVVVGNYLYAGLGTVPGKIVKIDLTTFTKVATLTLEPDESGVRDLVVVGNYLYAGLFPGMVVKIDLTTFTKVATLELATGEWRLTTLSVSGNYLYAGLDTSPGMVVKIDLTTFTRVDALVLDPDEPYIFASAIAGNYLYVGLSIPPGKIVKIDLTTFTKVATLTLAPGENNVEDLVVVGNYLYASLLYTKPGKIVKIDLTTFTKVATLTLEPEEERPYTLTVFGNYLFVGLDAEFPNKIVKVDLPTFTRFAAIILPKPAEYAVSALTTSGTCVYAGIRTKPGIIVKIDYALYFEGYVSKRLKDLEIVRMDDGVQLVNEPSMSGLGSVELNKDRLNYYSGGIRFGKVEYVDKVIIHIKWVTDDWEWYDFLYFRIYDDTGKKVFEAEWWNPGANGQLKEFPWETYELKIGKKNVYIELYLITDDSYPSKCYIDLSTNILKAYTYYPESTDTLGETLNTKVEKYRFKKTITEKIDKIEAHDFYLLDGKMFAFKKWSDGVTSPLRDVAVPGKYKAYYVKCSP